MEIDLTKIILQVSRHFLMIITKLGRGVDENLVFFCLLN